MSILVTKCSRLLWFASRPSVKLLKVVIGMTVSLVSQPLGAVSALIWAAPPATTPSASQTGFIQVRPNWRANRGRADGTPAPPASGPVEREVSRHRTKCSEGRDSRAMNAAVLRHLPQLAHEHRHIVVQAGPPYLAVRDLVHSEHWHLHFSAGRLDAH